jgi:predicted transcriptional regulator with HTH domain
MPYLLYLSSFYLRRDFFELPFWHLFSKMSRQVGTPPTWGRSMLEKTQLSNSLSGDGEIVYCGLISCEFRNKLFTRALP